MRTQIVRCDAMEMHSGSRRGREEKSQGHEAETFSFDYFCV